MEINLTALRQRVTNFLTSGPDSINVRNKLDTVHDKVTQRVKNLQKAHAAKNAPQSAPDSDAASVQMSDSVQIADKVARVRDVARVQAEVAVPTATDTSIDAGLDAVSNQDAARTRGRINIRA